MWLIGKTIRWFLPQAAPPSDQFRSRFVNFRRIASLRTTTIYLCSAGYYKTSSSERRFYQLR
jgi:hypothetical protein